MSTLTPDARRMEPIADIEARIGVALPAALKRWLVAVKDGKLQEGAAPGVGLRRR